MTRALKVGITVFLIIVLMIFVNAKAPYVSNTKVTPTLFTYSSAFVLIAFLSFFAAYKGTAAQPAGFHYFKKEWGNGNFLNFAKVSLSIPIFSALMGYFIAVFLATAPAYPTYLLSKQRAVANVECLSSGRDKVRGSWSVFRTESGEHWKVAGYPNLCGKNSESCKVEYIQGYFGSYITSVACEHG